MISTNRLSALREEARQIYFQSFILARASLKARYRNSILGYFWVILSPLANFSAQAYVFKMIFKIQIQNYFVFLLFSLVPWMFFAQTLDMTTTALFFNSKLLKSVQVHPLSLIFSQVIDNLINNFTVLIIVLLTLSYFDQVPWSHIYLFPLPYLNLVIFTLSLGFMLSALNIKYFDVKFVLTFVLGLLFFLSPILYPENFVPANAMFLVRGNPLYYILKPFRDLVEHGVNPSFFLDMLIGAGISLATAVISFFYWESHKNELYLRL